MPTPSGIPLPFQYLSTVSDAEFEVATDALDRALLREIGLPEDVDVRAFENAVFSIINKVNTLIRGFTLSTAIWVIPEIIQDGLDLWGTMKDVVGDKISRNDFIARTIVYAYKKHDPDLPILVEPFESLIENLILGAIPSLVANSGDNLEELIQSWIEKLSKFFT